MRVVQDIWGLKEYICVAKHLASGLACVHERGFLHYDLKPDNVGISLQQDRAKGMVVKLIDLSRLRPFGNGATTLPVGTHPRCRKFLAV